VKCANCGKKISKGVKFCPSCGAAVKSPSKAAEKGGAPAAERKVGPEDAGQNKGLEPH